MHAVLIVDSASTSAFHSPPIKGAEKMAEGKESCDEALNPRDLFLFFLTHTLSFLLLCEVST